MAESYCFLLPFSMILKPPIIVDGDVLTAAKKEKEEDMQPPSFSIRWHYQLLTLSSHSLPVFLFFQPSSLGYIQRKVCDILSLLHAYYPHINLFGYFYYG